MQRTAFRYWIWLYSFIRNEGFAASNCCIWQNVDPTIPIEATFEASFLTSRTQGIQIQKYYLVIGYLHQETNIILQNAITGNFDLIVELATCLPWLCLDLTKLVAVPVECKFIKNALLLSQLIHNTYRLQIGYKCIHG